MIVKDIEFTLKDGRAAVLRCPREEDVEGTLEYLRLSAEETDFLLRTPEETARFDHEAEKAFLDRVNENPDSLMLMCIVDGKVAGNCAVDRLPNRKTRHRASVGIALLKEFWGLGIGTRMFIEMERAVRREWEGVSQLELEFIEGNVRARGLYEKMGFRITGLRPDALKLSDGRLVNEYLMVKVL